jgi:hypothetical protein
MAADSDAAPELTVTLPEVAAVALLEVVTSNWKEPAADGASAVKSTSTLLPALTEQEAFSSMIKPDTLAEPAPPLPDVPDWMHEPSIRSTLVGLDPRLTEGATLTQSLVPPDSADTAVNVIVNRVEVLSVTALGVAATLLTAPDGLPIV